MAEEQARGKLTVFLGAFTGAGKTFAMLRAALEKSRAGCDVVIGCLETRAWAETDCMARHLECLPGQNSLEALDVDALRKRRPQLVLVDALARLNPKGARYRRRFRDVEELLAAGIDVYATLDVQHIESLSDLAAGILGVAVEERVPDVFVERAESVQFIDAVPALHLQRLRAARRPLPEDFFLGSLNALRELALRFTARRVAQKMEGYMCAHEIEGPWPVMGRVMVGVSGSPFSAQLIRAAARLADGLRSELLAVHVEVRGHVSASSDAERDRVAANLRLAEDLGAKTLFAVGENFVDEFLEIARRKNVSAIVVGKAQRRGWFSWSAADALLRRAKGFNVYVIQSGAAEKRRRPSPVRRAASRPFLPFLLSAAMVAFFTALLFAYRHALDLVDISLLYILPVFCSALWWGRWPSYLNAVMSILAVDYFFVQPVYSFNIDDVNVLWSCSIFLVLSFFIGRRTELLKNETWRARRQEERTRALYDFSREITAVFNRQSIAERLAKHAGEAIGRKVAILLPEEQEQPESAVCFDPAQDLQAGPVQAEAQSELRRVSAWVYRSKRPAGRQTETMPEEPYLYMPIMMQEKVYGIFVIDLQRASLSAQEKRLISAWVRLAGVAMEKISLAEQARQAKLVLESEKLRMALFNSVSHELKTPLAAIIGSISMLLDADTPYSSEDRLELLRNIQDSSRRMERLIANLLDSARMESGMMQIKADWCDVEDMIGTALRRMGNVREHMNLQVHSAADLPLVQADCGLIEQVLINLIDNAAKYSSGRPQIEIRASRVEGGVEVAVLDRGEGIVPQDIKRVFDKFYRSTRAKQVGGTGLGLAICKGIVEAHHGRIYARARAGGGTEMRFVLPEK